jgi:hypothetical protein
MEGKGNTMKDLAVYNINGSYYWQDTDGTLAHTRENSLKRVRGNKWEDGIEDLMGFIYEPNNLNFQQVVNNRYNTFKEFKHKAVKGNWDNVEKLLKHVFAEQYTMGLEYFWNLYVNPKQKLPLIALVSKKKNTGKSTFFEFVQAIFGNNVTPISNSDLSGKFNSILGEGYIFFSDEHINDERSNKSTINNLKKYITATKIPYEKKGQDSTQLQFYGKFLLASNDDKRLISIEDENRRFWVRQIPPINKEDEDFDFIGKLTDEIPAFLYHLKEEFEPRDKRGQLYFSADEIQTDASRLIQHNSKSDLYHELFTRLKEYFDNCEDCEDVYGNTTDLFNWLGNNKVSVNQIRISLNEEFQLETLKQQRYISILQPNTRLANSKTGTPFKFLREYFY